MSNMTRAAEYRARADALTNAAQDLPPSEQAIFLSRGNAFRQLADIEEWISVEPRPTGNKYDYHLTPRPSRMRAPLSKPRGRTAIYRPANDLAGLPIKVAAAPGCPNCTFPMTVVRRELTNERSLRISLFECRPCGIMVTPGAS